MGTTSDSGIRCGIVLAGGEGNRLRSFVHQIRGAPLPKQYVNFIGARSMLEHTLDRAEKLIPAQRLFTVMNRKHLAFSNVRRQIASRPKETIVIQPENKDTGPGVLLPLIHLYLKYPNASVAIFPSDHFIQEEDLFMAHVALAFHVVEKNPSRVVLLGAEPTEPEPEYGYLLPGKSKAVPGPLDIRRVSRFVEKPGPLAAQKLCFQGALWNTLVIIARARTLLDLIRRTLPDLSKSFIPIATAVGSPNERKAADFVYSTLNPVNLSKALLETLPLQRPSPLLVFPLSGVFWSDWGNHHRLLKVLKRMGYLGRLSVPEPQLFDFAMRA